MNGEVMGGIGLMALSAAVALLGISGWIFRVRICILERRVRILEQALQDAKLEPRDELVGETFQPQTKATHGVRR